MPLDYPLVCARLNKWQLLHLLAKAHVTRLSPASAAIYVAAICGPDTRLECRHISRSWAYKQRNLITLAKRRKDGTVALSSLLHEAAHILNYRKGKLSDGPHGEAFTRTYARLLKDDPVSVQILADRADEQAVLFCSTTDWAFGPVFSERDDRTATERAEAFLRWLLVDPRTLDEGDLERRYVSWLAQEAMQIARERLDALEQDEAEDILLDHEVPELAALRARTDLR